MSRTEPEMPSIRTPLAHENALTNTANLQGARPSQTRQLAPERRADSAPEPMLDIDAAPRWESSPPNGLNDIETSARRWPTARTDEPLTWADEEGREPEHSIGLEP